MLSVFVQFLKVQTDVMRFLSHYLHMVFIPIKLSEEYYMPPRFWSSNYKKTHAKNSPKPGYIKSLNTPGLKYWTNWSLNTQTDPSYRKLSSFFIYSSFIYSSEHLGMRLPPLSSDELLAFSARCVSPRHCILRVVLVSGKCSADVLQAHRWGWHAW